MITSITTIVLLSALACDEITLKSGGKIEGIVKEDGEIIRVETYAGLISFQRSEVVSIDRSKPAKIQIYYEKCNAIKESKNAEDFYQLAKWVKENNLMKFHKELLEKTIEFNTDHEFARRQLGYELYKGKWHTKQEIMMDKGFVLFDGTWMTESEKELRTMALKKKEARVNETKQEQLFVDDQEKQPKDQPDKKLPPPPQQRQIIDLYLYDYAKMSHLWYDEYLYMASRSYWWWLSGAYTLYVAYPAYCAPVTSCSPCPSYCSPSMLFVPRSSGWLGYR